MYKIKGSMLKTPVSFVSATDVSWTLFIRMRQSPRIRGVTGWSQSL